MTPIDLDRPRARESWARPNVVLPILGALMILLVLLTPDSMAGRLGDARLSSHLTTSLGARVLFEVAGRMGWTVVERDTEPLPSGLPGATVHAVLATPVPVTPMQAHWYMDAVRRGDALLYAIGDRSPLADSLGVWRTRAGGVLIVAAADSTGCTSRDIVPPLWPDGRAHLYGLRLLTKAHGASLAFAQVHGEKAGLGDLQVEDVAVGFDLGSGRVIVVADPDLLRNDVLRHCAWGVDVIAVRILEWLRAGGPVPRNALDFDEFHQGYGPSHSALATVGHFVGNHPVGRTILQCMLAALVLLLALSPRPLRPHERERIERRDPLEQIDALAHAYEQVGATRTITSRLLDGVRRRLGRPGSLTRLRTNEAFLDDVAVARPARAADVMIVRHALRDTGIPRDLPKVSAAIRRIEDSLSTTTA